LIFVINVNIIDNNNLSSSNDYFIKYLVKVKSYVES